METVISFIVGVLVGKLLEDNLPSFHYKNLWLMLKHGSVYLMVAAIFMLSYSLLRMRGVKKQEAFQWVIFVFMAVATAWTMNRNRNEIKIEN